MDPTGVNNKYNVPTSTYRRVRSVRERRFSGPSSQTLHNHNLQYYTSSSTRRQSLQLLSQQHADTHKQQAT